MTVEETIHQAQVFEPLEPLPVSPAETLLWRLEQAAVGAFRVTVLLRLTGRIEPRILSRALFQLQQRHPKLRASIATAADRQLQYRFDTTAKPIPFEIKDYDLAETPWREETRRLMQIVFPAEGPRAAVAVLRSTVSGVSELLLTVHHCVADGMSGIMLMDDLLTEYARCEADPHAPLGPALTPVTAPRAKSAGGWLAPLWLIRRFIRIQREERRSRQTTLPEAADIAPQSQWVHWVFSRKETLALIRQCRKERTSMGGLLIAAVCCGIMEALPQSQAIFKCQFPFSIRDSLKSSSGPVMAQDLGCFVSVMNAFYILPQQPSLWDLARQVYHDHEAFASHGGPGFYYNLASATASRSFERIGPKLLPHSDRRVTLLATNYGVAGIREEYGTLRPQECTLMFKNDIVGPPLVVEALVLGQRLNIGFAADGLAPAFWEQLQATVRRSLDTAAGPS